MRKRHLALAVSAAITLAGCGAAPDPSKELTGGKATVDTKNGLTVNGEQVVDKATYDAAKKEGELDLYTGYGADREKLAIQAFTQDTGIKVNMVRLVPNRLEERILSEQGAGKLSADVVHTSDNSGVMAMDEAKVFQPYAVPENLAKTTEDAGEKKPYHRVQLLTYTIGYNTQLVKEADAPKAWKDLLDPKWKGKLGIVQVGAGGSALALTQFQTDKLGPDYLKKYAAQKPRIFDSVGAALDSLARGEVSVTTALVSNLNVAAKQNAPVKLVAPSEGVAVYDYFMGLTAEPKHPAAAKAFMNWYFSKRTQGLIASFGEYPARSDVPMPSVQGVKLPALDSPQVYHPDPDKELARSERLQKDWNTTFGYSS